MDAGWLLPGQLQQRQPCRRRLHLDYGPFGFCELFDRFQPWTGGGAHFSFFNQPVAAERTTACSGSRCAPCSMATSAPKSNSINSRTALPQRCNSNLRRCGPASSACRLRRSLGQRAAAVAGGLKGRLHQSLPSALPDSRASQRLARQLLPAQFRGTRQPMAGLAAAMARLAQRQWRAQRGIGWVQRVNPAITWREWLIAPPTSRRNRAGTTWCMSCRACSATLTTTDRPTGRPLRPTQTTLILPLAASPTTAVHPEHPAGHKDRHGNGTVSPTARSLHFVLG